MLDLSTVPVNLLSLRGDAFYALVKELTSDDAEELLKMQRISTARCFLSTNPLIFFDLQSDDPLIVHLQNRLSFKSGDNKNVVLAGIYGDCSYLRRLFQTFLMANKKKKIDVINSTDTTHLSQQTSSMTTPTPPTDSPPEIKCLTITEHRNHISQQIDSWWKKYRSNHELAYLEVTELDEYDLITTNDTASVMCSCGEQISLPLPKGRLYYQLSNFYKHLTQNDQCMVIRRHLTKSLPQDDDDDSSSTMYSTK